ncbi:MAG: ion transporter [Clostridia bacterium]|nr:ion transporter [Clostridia bacterium]
MRKKIYKMVHIYNDNTANIIYKYFMVAVILSSLIPLMIKEPSPELRVLEIFCLVVYIIDYILRLITADYKFNKMHWTSFVRYPFRIISIIDMLSIVALFNSVLGLSPIFRVFNFRIVRIFRYSENVRRIFRIFRKAKKALISVASLAAGYIIISGIIMFNVEPDMFESFLDAVYWATVSLTTIGYGDICPTTAIGRGISVLSSFFGVAIVALPTSVVTAEYINSLNNKE